MNAEQIWRRGNMNRGFIHIDVKAIASVRLQSLLHLLGGECAVVGIVQPLLFVVGFGNKILLQLLMMLKVLFCLKYTYIKC